MDAPVEYRPGQCPTCQHHDSSAHLCRAGATAGASAVPAGYIGTSPESCPKYSSAALDLLGTGAIVRHLTSEMIVFAALLCVVAASFWSTLVDPSGLPAKMRPFAANPDVWFIQVFALVIVLLFGIGAVRRSKRSVPAPKLAFFSKFKSILLTPSQFFSNMPVNEGLGGPVMFCVICLSILEVFTSLAMLLAGQELALAVSFRRVALVAVLCFMIAAISYSVMRVFGSAPRGSFEATVRVAMYSVGVSILPASVPSLVIIFYIYGPVLMIEGLKSVYSALRGQAAVGVIIGYVIAVVVVSLISSMVPVPTTASG